MNLNIIEASIKCSPSAQNHIKLILKINQMTVATASLQYSSSNLDCFSFQMMIAMAVRNQLVCFKQAFTTAILQNHFV